MNTRHRVNPGPTKSRCRCRKSRRLTGQATQHRPSPKPMEICAALNGYASTWPAWTTDGLTPLEYFALQELIELAVLDLGVAVGQEVPCPQKPPTFCLARLPSGSTNGCGSETEYPSMHRDRAAEVLP